MEVIMMCRTEISNEYKALKYDLARTQRKYRNRRTACKWVMILMVAVVLTAVLVTIGSSNTFGSAEAMEVETVMVESGDSLWSIASQYAEGRDVREVVREIKAYNQMNNANLYPGMILEIPVSA